MLIAIAYCSHLARRVYELGINMILHTVFMMFVSFKTGVTFCYAPIFHCSNGVLENVPTIYLFPLPGVPQYRFTVLNCSFSKPNPSAMVYRL